MAQSHHLRNDDEEPTLPDLAREARVLVAEDDPAMRDLIVEVLHTDGRDVDNVGSGAAMLEILRERSVAMWPRDAFGVIVTDHRMPNGNGLDVAEQLRGWGFTTPILLITAFADERLRTRAEELDVMVMAKPFPLVAFRAAVNLLLALNPSGLGRPTPWRS